MLTVAMLLAMAFIEPVMADDSDPVVSAPTITVEPCGCSKTNASDENKGVEIEEKRE